MMRVEELISDTYPVWAGMRQALWEDHTEEKDRRQFQEYLARRQAGEALSYFAVSDNGDYTGFLDAALRVDHVDGVEHSPVWYVEGIFVVPEERGKGVGRFLCSVLERYARAQGYMMIASDCELDDCESEAFHKAVGFVEAIRSIHLTKSLDTDASEATEFEADSALWMPIVIRTGEPKDAEWLADLFQRYWSSTYVACGGRQIDLMAAKVRLACTGKSRVGAVNYILRTESCEIASLITELPHRGVGRRLVEEVEAEVVQAGCPTLTAVTTNDNTKALRFWQRQGFVIAGIDRDAVARARELKPSIPVIGNNGIPIRDEIILHKALT